MNDRDRALVDVAARQMIWWANQFDDADDEAVRKLTADFDAIGRKLNRLYERTRCPNTSAP